MCLARVGPIALARPFPEAPSARRGPHEPLLRAAGRVAAGDLAGLAGRHPAAGDARDVLAARDGLIRRPGLRPSGP
jgi:hypothetical protein